VKGKYFLVRILVFVLILGLFVACDNNNTSNDGNNNTSNDVNSNWTKLTDGNGTWEKNEFLKLRFFNDAEPFSQMVMVLEYHSGGMNGTGVPVYVTSTTIRFFMETAGTLTFNSNTSMVISGMSGTSPVLGESYNGIYSKIE